MITRVEAFMLGVERHLVVRKRVLQLSMKSWQALLEVMTLHHFRLVELGLHVGRSVVCRALLHYKLYSSYLNTSIHPSPQRNRENAVFSFK